MKNFLRHCYYPIYLIAINAFLYFYSNKNFNLFCELKYVVNTNLTMYLLVSFLLTFGNYYFFHRHVFNYFELKTEICTRVGNKRFTWIILRLLLMFSLFYLVGNGLIDLVLFTKLNFSFITIDYIIMLATNSLLFLCFKKYDWIYVVSCLLAIFVKGILITFVGI